MPAIDDLRDLLDHQRRAIESSEPGVRDGADPESLHRFRVATRRSRALIRASRPLVRDQLASLDRELRWLGGVSGPVRDLDVLVDHLGGMLDELGEDRAGGESIIAELEKERAAQRGDPRRGARHRPFQGAARPVRRGSADVTGDGRRGLSRRDRATRVRAAPGGLRRSRLAAERRRPSRRSDQGQACSLRRRARGARTRRGADEPRAFATGDPGSDRSPPGRRRRRGARPRARDRCLAYRRRADHRAGAEPEAPGTRTTCRWPGSASNAPPRARSKPAKQP